MTLAAAFDTQAQACTHLGSPFTARLLRACWQVLDDTTATGARILNWPGDAGNMANSVALRLARALHGLVQQDAVPALKQVHPPNPATCTALEVAVAATLRRHDKTLLAALDNPPQTKDVRRSAVLLAIGSQISGRFRTPLILSEMGASAGLNLIWDHYALRLGDRRIGAPDPALVLTPDWQGPLPPANEIQIVERPGVDLRPIDVTDAADQRRLRSYIWPDQIDRMALTDAAIAAAARIAPQIDRGDAADWLQRRLARPPQNAAHLIYHTVAWQYFTAATRTRVTATILAAGALATADAPLIWFAMAADGAQAGAALRLRVWPEGCDQIVGRASFHGHWVQWTDTPLWRTPCP